MAVQRTLASPSVMVRGVGLHSGSLITMRLLPADADCGIRIRCLHLDGKEIELCAGNVTDTLLATTLTENGASVSTLEHLLCALCLCGVDNVIIEINGAEVPIMDGSAVPFVLVIHDTGMVEQNVPKRFLQVTEIIEVELEDELGRIASFSPAPEVSWEVAVDFADATISKTPQHLSCDLSDHEMLAEQIAPARTFGFVHELDYLRKNNRALGGSLDNAVVINGKGVINQDGLRQPNEFVAHKLLDVIGDCYVEGKLVLGKYKGSMPGHRLNNELMRKLLATPSAFDTVTSHELETQPQFDFGPLMQTRL